MKNNKFYLFTVLFALLSVVACKKTTEEVATETRGEENAQSLFVSECLKEVQIQASEQGIEVEEAVARQYCECSAAYIFKEMTLEEIAALEEQNVQMISKAQRIVAPCLQDFIQYMNAKIEEKYSKNIAE